MPGRWCQNCRDPRCCHDPRPFQLFLGPPNFCSSWGLYFFLELVILRGLQLGTLFFSRTCNFEGAPVDDSIFFRNLWFWGAPVGDSIFFRNLWFWGGLQLKKSPCMIMITDSTPKLPFRHYFLPNIFLVILVISRDIWHFGRKWEITRKFSRYLDFNTISRDIIFLQHFHY